VIEAVKQRVVHAWQEAFFFSVTKRCLTASITARAFAPGSCLSMIDAAGFR